MDVLICSTCHIPKKPTAFVKRKRSRTGYYRQCKECINARDRGREREAQRRRRAANPGVEAARKRQARIANLEATRAKDRAAYHANRLARRLSGNASYHRHQERNVARAAIYREINREALCLKARAYAVKHRQKRLAQRRAYYHDNTAQCLARRVLWAQQHPDAEKARQARWRARKRGASVSTLTTQQWREILAAYDHRCVYCSRKMQRLTQDHLLPLSKGGEHTVHNVVPACRSCNSRKKAGPPLKPVQPLLLTIAPDRKAG